MSNITGSGDLGNFIRDLRDRAALTRRIAEEVSDNEAVKSLKKHAHDLEQQAKDLEDRLLRAS
jgi:hypothetical protein